MVVDEHGVDEVKNIILKRRIVCVGGDKQEYQYLVLFITGI